MDSTPLQYGMRIIGGRLKGRGLRAPAGDAVRPTLAKIREAFFDIVGPRIMDAVFLDLYAGTGAMGIEALSRGARMVYFVERSGVVSTLLSKNLALIEDGLLDRKSYTVMKMDAKKALVQLAGSAAKIDIAYVDPPYEDTRAYGDVVPFLIDGGITRDAFLIGIEHTAHAGGTPGSMKGTLFESLHRRVYKYGDKYLTIVRR
ncbi:MAG: 16S rRNA (guanine(966)-N(2))-methyltransferase RsmD [Deltaproteobacteria bacterium]|nr:16S rRNA (guanine(966)-N(2))-methyltransferase RsmD [Deltaproteobacteria bacterium]